MSILLAQADDDGGQLSTAEFENMFWLFAVADEMLRWWTPVMTFRRTATSDCELDGQRIRAGDKVVVSFSSANRDEAVFADPSCFDIAATPTRTMITKTFESAQTANPS